MTAKESATIERERDERISDPAEVYVSGVCLSECVWENVIRFDDFDSIGFFLRSLSFFGFVRWCECVSHSLR